jgi:hypothetical protein
MGEYKDKKDVSVPYHRGGKENFQKTVGNDFISDRNTNSLLTRNVISDG